MGAYDAYAPVGAPPQEDGIYNYGERPRRDASWGAVYLVTLAATVGLAVYAGANKNPDYDKLASSESLHSYATCSADVAGTQRFGAASQGSDDIDVDHWLARAKGWLAISAAGSFVIGLAFLYLFKNHARTMVKVVCFLKVASLVAMGAVCLANGAGLGALVCMVLALLMVWVFWMWRVELEMCARLLAVSAAGLQDNPALAGTVVAIKLGLLAVLVPHAAGIALGFMNGEPAKSPEVASVSGNTCYDQSGQEVDCCVWQPEGWVPAYVALACFSGLWSAMLAFDLRLYTIAGSITQWYFAPQGSSTAGSTMRSLRHGLGASFGTICLGSLVLAVIEILRQMNEAARRQSRRQGGFAAVLGCIISSFIACIYTVIEFLSKFAIIQAAITGDAFCDAARSVTDLLKRNFLASYSVWWVPPMVLHTTSFLLAAFWGLVAGWMSHHAFDGDKDHTSEAVLVGVVAFLCAALVLSFFNSLLLNIVDTVFVCFATDKDRAMCTKAEVHEIFAVVPVTIGPVVEQPDGGIAYAPPPRVPEA